MVASVGTREHAAARRRWPGAEAELRRHLMMSDPAILMVEDELPLLRLVEMTLARQGLNIDTAPDGLAALELMARRRYDLVLLDLMMPRLSGYDLIGELGRMEPRPAVIVITAMPETAPYSLDPQVVTAVVRKPFDVELLVSVVAEIARAISREERPRRPPPEQPRPNC